MADIGGDGEPHSDHPGRPRQSDCPRCRRAGKADPSARSTLPTATRRSFTPPDWPWNRRSGRSRFGSHAIALPRAGHPSALSQRRREHRHAGGAGRSLAREGNRRVAGLADEPLVAQAKTRLNHRRMTKGVARCGQCAQLDHAYRGHAGSMTALPSYRQRRAHCKLDRDRGKGIARRQATADTARTDQRAVHPRAGSKTTARPRTLTAGGRRASVVATAPCASGGRVVGAPLVMTPTTRTAAAPYPAYRG
jgi:hypothetical protein